MRSIRNITNPMVINVLLHSNEMVDSQVFNGLDGVWFTLYSDKELAGMINLRAINNVLWVPHIFIVERYRGNGSEKWGKLVARFMRKNLGAEKFLVFTPFEAAARYAEKVGFKYIATLSDSVKKNDELLSQYVLELGEEN